MRRPDKLMLARLLAWFLSVPVTPASLAAMGPLALMLLAPQFPKLLRGWRLDWFVHLAARLDDEMVLWADGSAEAGERAQAIMAELEAFRRSLPVVFIDTRALPIGGHASLRPARLRDARGSARRGAASA